MLTFDRNVVLGDGGFGVVIPGTWEIEKGVNIKVAVKRVLLQKLKENDQHEEQNLKKLNHTQVVKLFCVLDDKDFRNFILELCDASLDQVFLSSGNPKKYKGPKLPHYSNVLLQLATGLEYIHSNNLIHRDVKPDNVLISVDSITKSVTLKWADFGLSRPVNERGTYEISKIKGSKNWYAPELIIQYEKNEKESADLNQPIMLRGSVKSDIFSEGLVFGYYLNDGKHPYYSEGATIESNIKTKNPAEVLKLKSMHSHYTDVIVKMLANEEVRIKSPEVVDRLIGIEEQLNKKLMYLCVDKTKTNPKKIKALLESGVNINCVDSNGLTPLLLVVNRTRYSENNFQARKESSEQETEEQTCKSISESDFIFQVLTIFTENDELEVSCRQKDGANALHVICRYYQGDNLIDLVKLLIKKGIDVNQTTRVGSNALNLNAQCAYDQRGKLLNLVNPLCEIYANYRYADGSNALLILCQYYRGDNLLEIVKLFIDNKTNINHCNSKGWNVLLILCQHYKNENLFEIVQLLIKNGIDINQTNNNGNNALNFLAGGYEKENLIDIVEILIKNKINVNCINKDENTALLLLCQFYRGSKFLEIVKLLIKSKINVNHSNSSLGWNALHILCRFYHNENLIKFIKLLIDEGINIKFQDNEGENALLILCDFYQNENLYDIIKLFVKAGIDVNIKKKAIDILRQRYKKLNFSQIEELLTGR